MKLDFTALDGLQRQPSTTAPEAEKADTAQKTRPYGGLYKLERERSDREQARQVYAVYQQNIKRAGTLASEITKGIQNGEEPINLLLKAIECISLMTDDTVIYKQAKEDIAAVYNWETELPFRTK